MNDEFMHQLYEAPRAEFADLLFERISKEPQSHFAQIFINNRTFRSSAIALAFLFLIAAGVYVAYQSRWNKVGGIWVDVQQTLTLEWGPSDLEIREQEPECLTVEEAREILRFDFQVPTWAPDGFTFDNRMCGIDTPSDFAGLYWKGADPYSGISITLRNLRWFNVASQEYEVGHIAVPVILAACLAASSAFAAKDIVVASFESLSASGVSGQVRLNPMPGGGTQVHANLEGLQAGVEYVSLSYQGEACATGTSTELARFTANPAGRATFHQQVPGERTSSGYNIPAWSV